jgi:ribosomal protein S18 acetylase RimI-like enzyme
MIAIDLPPDIRRAEHADWKRVADITAEAFAEDPVNLWIFGNARAIRSLFRIFARDIYTRKGVCHVYGNAAATMWADESVDLNIPPFSLFQLIVAQRLLGSKGSVGRGLAAGKAMEVHHPREPHLYLFTIGTRKPARGKGLGKAMLQPVLDAADRAGKPIYLENSNPVNSGFYQSHGFRRRGEPFYIAEGAPVMEPMWREPKSVQG